MSLKEKLDSLTSEQRRRLMHAFNNHISQHVNLPCNKFVGVHVRAPNLKIEESVGAWSFGTRISKS